MGSLSFTIPGRPVPWARARRAGRRYFTSEDVTRHQRAVVAAALAAGATTLEGALFVEVVADYCEEETRISIEPAPVGHAGKVTRPDVDNLIKLPLDALNGICWKDDAQVVRVVGVKLA